MSYTDYFSGSDTVPPSQYAYVKHDGLSAGPYTLVWPQEYSGTQLVLAAITEVEVATDSVPDPGGLTITVLLPDATGASVGEDFIIANLSADDFVIQSNTGAAIVTIAPGEVQYFYLSDNSTASGTWRTFLYGAGVNNLSASVLAGPGLKAISTYLVTNNLYRTISFNYSIVAADRARLINVTSGTVTTTLPQASTVDDGFWVMIRNSGAGTATVEGFGTELVDGALNKTLSPNESAIFVCNSAAWFTVGYGRSAEFVFSEYVIDAAVGNTTVSSADVSGRMLRVAGTAAGNFTVTLPSIDNIYFVIVEAGMGGFNVTFKTALGVGVTLSANQSAALYSDGTDVASAVTVVTVSAIDLADGSAVVPSLKFLLDSDTGLFRAGANTLGIAAGGVQVGQFSSLGLTGSVVFTPTGGIAATTVAGALAELDTEKVAKAGDTMTGNLVFSGNGLRLQGDMTNATVANRFLFQNSVVDGASSVAAIPNGTSVVAAFTALNNSNPANASAAQLLVNGTVAALNSTSTGAGTPLPLVFQIAGGEVGRFSTGGLLGVGGPPVGALNREITIDSGSGTFAGITLVNDSTGRASTDGTLFYIEGSAAVITNRENAEMRFATNNTERMRINASGGVGVGGVAVSKMQVFAGANDGFRITSTDGTTLQGIVFNTNNNQMSVGTVTAHPLTLFTNNTAQAVLTASGQFLLGNSTGGLGYTTGAGGTVTQATSKSTGVTLNRPTGQITMNGAALAANTGVGFTLTNSVIAATDLIFVQIQSGVADPTAYVVSSANAAAGSAGIYVRNVTGGSLSENLVLKFAVIKGVTS